MNPKSKQTKYHLNGKEINLTSDNTTINSTNFKVDKDGNMECSNAKVTGGSIDLTSDEFTPRFRITDKDNINKLIQAGASGIFIFYDNNGVAKNIASISSTTSSDGTIGAMVQVSSPDGSKNSSLSEEELFVNTAWVSELKYYTLTQRSQEELKKNIIKYNKNCIDIVKDSDIYEFNYKTENDADKKHIGFIIGENYKTPNEIISKNGDGIDRDLVSSILWKAFQEQQEVIENLQTQIKVLKGETNEQD